MFKEMIEKQRVIFADAITGWEAAIEAAAAPLLRDGAIKESYITAMIDCVKEHGPYIVIAPDIAFAHARGEYGVNETSFSLMRVKEPVHFSENPEHDARLIFVLASKDNESHISLLQSMVEALSNQETVENIIKAENMEALKKVV